MHYNQVKLNQKVKETYLILVWLAWLWLMSVSPAVCKLVLAYIKPVLEVIKSFSRHLSFFLDVIKTQIVLVQSVISFWTLETTSTMLDRIGHTG